jgi:hypothetical protein
MMKICKSALFLTGFIIISCTGQKNHEVLKIGFGKADLTRAGLFNDPVSDHKNHESDDKFRREEKFAISDRVEGR